MHRNAKNLPAGCRIFPGGKPATLDRMYRPRKSLPRIAKLSIRKLVVPLNHYRRLTPIGALAGIMWLSLLKKQNVTMRYLDFIRYGAAVSLPSLAAALGVLALLL